MGKITSGIRKAYAEVDELINLFTDYEKQRIPEKVREFIKNEKDKEYVKKIDPNVPIKEQGLKQETLAIIAYLNLEYICQNEEEKEKLRQIYKNNEEKYKEVFQISFESDKIFSKEEKIEEIKEEKQIIITEKGDSFISKIINKILRFFNKKKI